MQRFELHRGLPAGHGRELVTRTLVFRAFLLGFADQPGPVKTEVELPYLLEPVSRVANPGNGREHLRLVFRGVRVEHARAAGGGLSACPKPQMSEQLDVQAGLIEGDANLAMA